MHYFRRMMVGLTNTAADRELIRYAAAAGPACGLSHVQFVHVLPDPPPRHGAGSTDASAAEPARSTSASIHRIT